MIKSKLDKSERWFRKNSFEYNQDYTEKILSRFNITKYNFTYNKSGVLDLLIQSGLKKYKIIIDKQECLTKVYRCEVRCFSKYTKENMKLKKTFGNDCIYESIKWVSKDSSMK